MDMNKKRKIRKENKNEREETNLKKGASINWDVHIYVPVLFSSAFTRDCAK